MKSIFVTLCTIFLLSAFCFCDALEARHGKLQWLTNYEEAVNQSKASSKPIVLFFTGSDWCGWCTKLEQEVLNTDEFADEVKDKFIFVMLDFPMHKALDSKLSAQNKELQKKFDVRSFPTIVVLNSQQQQVGVTGYRPGGGRQYAAHLFKMVGNYSSYRQKLQDLDKQKISGADLKQLYEKSLELGLDNDAMLIMKAGMQSDQSLFFLVERYRALANEGLIHEPEAVALRRQLMASDPKNSNLTHYQVAVIDFEAYCEEMEKEKYSPDLAIAPLVDYIDKFGENDNENLWRLEMIISQVYLDKNRLPEAIKYAQAAYESAPSTVRPEIATAIKNIHIQTH